MPDLETTLAQYPTCRALGLTADQAESDVLLRLVAIQGLCGEDAQARYQPASLFAAIDELAGRALAILGTS